MQTIRSAIVLGCVALLAASCATSQSRYVPIGKQYPPRPEGYVVEVFRAEPPSRPFERVSRLDVHLEKAFFAGSSIESALPELTRQARLSGADALVDVRESHSMVGETKVYHVTATGIRYTGSE